MVWTMRRILTLIGVITAAAVFATLFWVSKAYEGFSVNTLNSSSTELGRFLINQRIRQFYFENATAIMDEWSRQSTLVEGTRTNDPVKARIGADQTFNTKEVLEKIILLRAVNVFDKNMELLTQSEKGEKHSLSQTPEVIEKLRQREKREQRQPVAFLWTTAEGAPVHSVIVPIGGFRVAGFVEYVTSPVNRLEGLEQALGGQIRISDPSGALLVESIPLASGSEQVSTSETTENVTDNATDMLSYRELTAHFA